MNRRNFIKLLGLGTGALLVPEPVRKYFFFGGVKTRIYRPNISEIVALEYERMIPKVAELFERDDIFYAQIAKRDLNIVSSREIRIPLDLSKGLIIDIK